MTSIPSICALNQDMEFTQIIYIYKNIELEKMLNFNLGKEAGGKSPQLFKLDNNKVLHILMVFLEKDKTNTHPKIKDEKFYIWNGCNFCNYTYKFKVNLKKENKKTDFRIREISINNES